MTSPFKSEMLRSVLSGIVFGQFGLVWILVLDDFTFKSVMC